MTSTLPIGDAVALSRESSGSSQQSHTSQSLPSVPGEFGHEPNPVTQNTRKRRRAAPHLERIAIGKLSTSNESLNSSGGSDDDSQPGATSAAISNNGDEESQGGQLWGSGEAAHKRFCGLSASQGSQRSLSSSSQEDGGDDLAVVECSQSGSTSVKVTAVASGGLLIGDGCYEIVGDGRECKAVNIRDKTIFHCLIMKSEEYQVFLTVLERLKTAESTYNDKEEYDRLKDLLIPDQTQPIFGNNGNWYVLLPDHQGNLHSMMRPTCSGDSSPANKSCSERRVQPIFKQIVELVDFCHSIGIYFRDFRLRKFVFTDKEKTRIRLNNVLDLWVAPQIGDDQISQRYKSQVCPVYVSPEIFDASPSYAGPADVWALGVLMFSLVMGRFPFNEPNPTALFKRIKARRFSCLLDERISHSARWLVHSLLRPVPADRPKADEILQWHWLQADPDTLPDSRDSPALQLKSAGGLTMNSQQPVFSSTSLPPPLGRSLSATSPPTIPNSDSVVRQQGSPPAFVRLNYQAGMGVGSAALPLQQAAAVQQPAIHVRLALVSPRGAQQTAREAVMANANPLPHAVTHFSTDDLTDHVVPGLAGSKDAQPPSGGDSGLTVTISDHYYSRSLGGNSSSMLSVQSFPPTGSRPSVSRQVSPTLSANSPTS